MSKKPVDASITESVLEHLRRNVNPESFDAYFCGLSIRIEENGTATVLTTTRHARESLEKIYKREILDAIRTAMPSLVEVNFLAAGKPANESSTTLGTVLKTSEKQSPFGARPFAPFVPPLGQNKLGANVFVQFEPPLSQLFRLENFESGLCNKIACAAAQTVVESPGIVYCPLYIYGGHGLGKVGSSRVDLQACKLEYSIVSPK